MIMPNSNHVVRSARSKISFASSFLKPELLEASLKIIFIDSSLDTDSL